MIDASKQSGMTQSPRHIPFHQRARFAILMCALIPVSLLCGCAYFSRTNDNASASDGTSQGNRNGYRAPVRLCEINSREVAESSGIAASRTTPGYIWTHNDSGGGAYIYAFNRQCRRGGTWRVTGASARDWEDIAARTDPASGRSYLYIGDTGDNRSVRENIIVYRVEEPAITPTDAATNRANARNTAPAVAIRLRYPDGAHDAEALLVHPTTGDIYIITKEFGRAAGVYKARAPHNEVATTTLERVGEVMLASVFGSIVTGGDISADGTRVALCDYFQAYELILPEGSNSNFDVIWRERPTAIPLGERRQGEAIAYRPDGRALLATSEQRPSPLIEVTR